MKLYNGKFSLRYQALKAYFHGLIFVVCPEKHHNSSLLSVATIQMSRFSWLMFRLEAFRNKNKEELIIDSS